MDKIHTLVGTLGRGCVFDVDPSTVHMLTRPIKSLHIYRVSFSTLQEIKVMYVLFKDKPITSLNIDYK